MSSFAASEREETPASAAPAASKARSPTLPAGSEEPGRAARAAGGATPALPRCPAPAAPPSPSPAGGSDLVSVLSWRSGAEPAGANPGACSALGAAEPGRGVDGPRAASPALAGRGLSRDLLELVTLGEASGSGLGAGLAWGSGHGAGGDSRRPATPTRTFRSVACGTDTCADADNAFDGARRPRVRRRSWAESLLAETVPRLDSMAKRHLMAAFLTGAGMPPPADMAREDRMHWQSFIESLDTRLVVWHAMAEAGALDAMQLASLHSFNELVAPRVCKAKAELVEAERG